MNNILAIWGCSNCLEVALLSPTKPFCKYLKVLLRGYPRDDISMCCIGIYVWFAIAPVIPVEVTPLITQLHLMNTTAYIRVQKPVQLVIHLLCSIARVILLAPNTEKAEWIMVRHVTVVPRTVHRYRLTCKTAITSFQY